MIPEDLMTNIGLNPSNQRRSLNRPTYKRQEKVSMRGKLWLLALMAAAFTPSTYASADMWNQFRGTTGDGISTTSQPPVEFDESKNVRWKTAIPDSGWSSPAIWEDEIWLTTGSDEKRELRALCVHRETGEIIKNIKVFDMVDRQVDPAYKHASPHPNSPATPTPVVEADRVYVSFGSQGIACLNRMTGDKIWQRRDLRIYQPVRQGSSPIVDDDNLYVAFDGTDQQFFIALDKDTGSTRWKTDRNITTDWAATLEASGISTKKGGSKSNDKPGDHKKAFATATLINVDGVRQLIAPAAEATIAYAPQNGEELWRVMHPGGFNVSARPIFQNGLVYVFTSGLTRHFLAIKPDGRGDVTDSHIAWSTKRGTPAIPSPIVMDEHLYMVTDKGGIARCLNAKTGEPLWTKRLGGDHWASPVYANGMLYFCNKQGEVTVLEASPEEPTVRATNQLNGSFIASPALTDDSLILRSTTHLYCLTEGHQRSEQELAKEASDDTKIATNAKKGNGKEIDWDAAFEEFLKKDSGARKKFEDGQATKEEIIAWMKSQLGGAKKRGKRSELKKGGDKDNVNFYAIVIGRLKTKDIELGEFTATVDHVTSMYGNRWVRDEINGKTVRVTGVSGQFLDNLLQVKRGQTLKFRTGNYKPSSQTLTFGPKFHVLERTPPFNPEDYGVPPEEFRGYQGELTGKVVEAAGYEVLLEVSDLSPASQSKASKPEKIQGKRVRIIGFYNGHADSFNDLRQGDRIRVGVWHTNPSHDEVNVTDLLDPLSN